MDKGEAANGLQETTKPPGAMILLCDSRRDMASYFMLLLGVKILPFAALPSLLFCAAPIYTRWLRRDALALPLSPDVSSLSTR